MTQYNFALFFLPIIIHIIINIIPWTLRPIYIRIYFFSSFLTNAMVILTIKIWICSYHRWVRSPPLSIVDNFKNSQNNNQIWCSETFLVWRNSKLGPQYTSSNCPLDTRGCHSRIVNLCICLFVCLCILRQTKLGAWGGYVNRMGWLQELLTKLKTRPQRLSHFKTTLKPELFGTCGLQNQFWTNL